VNLVDSSAWLEYFADGPNAGFFAPAVEAPARMVVPSITIFEVFKRVIQQRGEPEALHIVAVMQQGRVIDLDARIALHAAKLGHELKLPLADSVILATARQEKATIWTQDADFEALENVQYRAKRS
jgi:predicted nucleic acid-binding protein